MYVAVFVIYNGKPSPTLHPKKTYHQFVVLYDIALQKLTMQFVGHKILALSRGAAEASDCRFEVLTRQ